MNILVLGGAGYIGSHTALELVKAGHDVIVADNNHDGCAEAIEKFLLQILYFIKQKEESHITEILPFYDPYGIRTRDTTEIMA